MKKPILKVRRPESRGEALKRMGIEIQVEKDLMATEELIKEIRHLVHREMYKDFQDIPNDLTELGLVLEHLLSQQDEVEAVQNDLFTNDAA